jgi:Skp family chaperone for outer membrane proteins
MARPGAVRHLAAALLVWALSALPSAAQLQPPEPAPGILVVNQERLIAQSRYGRRIQAELEEVSAALAAENRSIEARLTAEELELTELRDTLPPEDFRARADAFDTRVEQIRAEQEAKARDLTEQADMAQAQFFERAGPILLGIVRERGAAVLMDSRAVLLSAERVDITEEAIAEIDATLGDGGPDPIIALDIDPPEDGGGPAPERAPGRDLLPGTATPAPGDGTEAE